MTVENCLGTINMCLCWIFLIMVTVWAECYCGTLSLRRPFFAKGLGYFGNVLSFCVKMPGIIHPTWQLFMSVHVIGYGSVPMLCSVFYLSLNPWETPGWQAIAVDADVKQLSPLGYRHSTTVPYPGIYALVPLWANGEMVVVTTLRCDVYHLLHICHVLVKVTITLWRVFVTLFFLKFFVYTLQSEQVSS